MARYSKRHPCYRTLDQIADDVAHVLNAPLAHGTQHAVLKDACWTWTEGNGKYHGCPRWTKLAVQRRCAAKEHDLIRRGQGLRHEHAVPLMIVYGLLRELKSPTPEMVYAVCERFLIGVVVTQEEDRLLNVHFRKTMPPEFWEPTSPEYHDPLLRYKRCQIEILQLKDNWWLDIPAVLNRSNDNG